MPGLRDGVVQAMRSGLAFAGSHLLEKEGALEAEIWYPSELRPDQRERLLTSLLNDPGLSEQALQDHLGAPPIEADRQTHNVMVGVLRHAFPQCYVVGEEANEEEWAAAEQAPVGSLIFSIDAIDGSSPYECLSFGFSSNVLAYRRSEAVDHLLLAAVANSSQLVTIYDAPEAPYSVGEVVVGTLDHLKSITEPAAQDFRNETVAVTAAAPHARDRARLILDDPALTVFTTGGAPAALGLIAGRLGALVCTEDQTTHDAAYLPILAFLGIPIVIGRSLALALPDVLKFFEHVARTQADRLSHPVPSFAAARDPRTAFELARRLPQHLADA